MQTFCAQKYISWWKSRRWETLDLPIFAVLIWSYAIVSRRAHSRINVTHILFLIKLGLFNCPLSPSLLPSSPQKIVCATSVKLSGCLSVIVYESGTRVGTSHNKIRGSRWHSNFANDSDDLCRPDERGKERTENFSNSARKIAREASMQFLCRWALRFIYI